MNRKPITNRYVDQLILVKTQVRSVVCGFKAYISHNVLARPESCPV